MEIHLNIGCWVVLFSWQPASRRFPFSQSAMVSVKDSSYWLVCGKEDNVFVQSFNFSRECFAPVPLLFGAKPCSDEVISLSTVGEGICVLTSNTSSMNYGLGVEEIGRTLYMS